MSSDYKKEIARAQIKIIEKDQLERLAEEKEERER